MTKHFVTVNFALWVELEVEADSEAEALALADNQQMAIASYYDFDFDGIDDNENVTFTGVCGFEAVEGTAIEREIGM